VSKYIKIEVQNRLMSRKLPPEARIAEEFCLVSINWAKLRCKANFLGDPGIKADGPLIEHMDGSHDYVHAAMFWNGDENPNLLGGL